MASSLRRMAHGRGATAMPTLKSPARRRRRIRPRAGDRIFGLEVRGRVRDGRPATSQEGLAKSAGRVGGLAFCKSAGAARGLYALKPRAHEIVRTCCAAPTKTFTGRRERTRATPPARTRISMVAFTESFRKSSRARGLPRPVVKDLLRRSVEARTRRPARRLARAVAPGLHRVRRGRRSQPVTERQGNFPPAAYV